MEVSWNVVQLVIVILRLLSYGLHGSVRFVTEMLHSYFFRVYCYCVNISLNLSIQNNTQFKWTGREPTTFDGYWDININWFSIDSRFIYTIVIQ